MKNFILTYTHCGNVNNYETQDLFRFIQKFEQVLDDPNILDSSISINTVETVVPLVPVSNDNIEAQFPKYKLFESLK